MALDSSSKSVSAPEVQVGPLSRLLFWISEGIFRSISPLFVRLSHAFPKLKRHFKSAFYNRLHGELESSGVNKLRLLNYGYAEPNGSILPFELDEKDRKEYIPSWELIYKTVQEDQVAGKEVLVVGCGRGGDAYFIKRYLGASRVVAVDLSPSSIEACQRFYRLPGLTFEVGDAEKLLYENNFFDAIVSIESSHCYGSLLAFYQEVFRLLKPNGRFLFSDYFWSEEFRDQLKTARLKVVEEEDITEGVLQACREGQATREALAVILVPRFLYGMLREMGGFPGSKIYRMFEQRAYRYYRFSLIKTPI